jgi:hypothetical protein
VTSHWTADVVEDSMNRYRSAMAALLAAGAVSAGLMAPLVSAEPSVVESEETLPESETSTTVGDFASEPTPVSPVGDACNRFAAALSHAAAEYEEFAYATAGGGNYVNYSDPIVERYSLIGRAALRESAAEILDASRTAGLSPDIADPMRDWSLHATKLLLIMSVRGGGDSLNNAANQLNSDAERAQLACAVNLSGGAAG